jgi:hypothetical protein
VEYAILVLVLLAEGWRLTWLVAAVSWAVVERRIRPRWPLIAYLDPLRGPKGGEPLPNAASGPGEQPRMQVMP